MQRLRKPSARKRAEAFRWGASMTAVDAAILSVLQSGAFLSGRNCVVIKAL